GRTGLHGREDVDKARVVPPLTQQLSDPILFAEVLAPDELDGQTSFPRQPFDGLADLLPQWLRPLGVIKEPKFPLGQVLSHGLGMAYLWECPGDHDPVKAGKHSRNFVRIPFRQYDHGGTLQGCRGTYSGNRETIPYPCWRYLFGSGSAGLGKYCSLV